MEHAEQKKGAAPYCPSCQNVPAGPSLRQSRNVTEGCVAQGVTI